MAGTLRRFARVATHGAGTFGRAASRRHWVADQAWTSPTAAWYAGFMANPYRSGIGRAMVVACAVAGCSDGGDSPADGSPAGGDGMAPAGDAATLDSAPGPDAAPGESCASAQPVEGASWTVTFSINLAAADHVTGCSLKPLPDLVFAWTAPASGRAFIAASSPIGDDDATAETFPSQACSPPASLTCGVNTEFDAVAGVTYYIVVFAHDPQPSEKPYRLSGMLVQ